MDYLSVRAIHLLCVSLSLAGFIIRGLGIVAHAGWAAGRMARTLPHINDSILLVSALWLAWKLDVTLGNSPWLLAKVVGLLVYIALGSVAIRPGRPLLTRILAWCLALVVFGYIVSVAISKHPAGFLLHFGMG